MAFLRIQASFIYQLLTLVYTYNPNLALFPAVTCRKDAARRSNLERYQPEFLLFQDKVELHFLHRMQPFLIWFSGRKRRPSAETSTM